MDAILTDYDLQPLGCFVPHQRSLRHLLQSQRSNNTIEIAFFADDKVLINLPNWLNQTFFIGR